MDNTSIAMVNYSRKNDGTAIAARIYYETLLEMKYDIRWYQYADYSDQQDYMEYPTVIPGSRFSPRTLRPGYDRLVNLPARKSLIKERKIFLSDPTLLRIAKGRDFMVKVHDLNPLSSYREKISSWAMFKYAIPRLRLADTIITTTDYMRETITELVQGLGKVFVVPEPVFKQKTNNSLNSRTLEPGDRKINLLYVAADRPYKNIRMFFDLAANFQRQGLDQYRFRLVTKPKESTISYLKSLGLKNLEVFTDIPDMNEVYGKTDILIYPSLYEGFGRPIVEALSMGIPTIAKDIQPFREIIGNYGMLIGGDSLDKWTEAILKISDQTTYSTFSIKAFDRYRKSYSYEIFKERLEDAFKYFLEN